MAQWKKNQNRVAAAASSPSSKHLASGDQPTIDDPNLKQLRILNVRLVTEMEELRKQIKLLPSELAASKNSVQFRPAVSDDVPYSPPMEVDLEAKEAISTKTSVSPVEEVDSESEESVAAETSVSPMELVATVRELHEEGNHIGSEYSEILDQPADAEEILSPPKTAPCNDDGVELESDTEPASDIKSGANVELQEEANHIGSEYSEILDKGADAEEILSPLKTAPPSKQLCSDLSSPHAAMTT